MHSQSQIGRLIAVLTLFLATSLIALGRPCGIELRRRGNVSAVNLVTQEVTIINNLGGTGQAFLTDASTNYNGARNSLAEVQVGDKIEIRYEAAISPFVATRLDASPAPMPPAGALVIELDVPPGSEVVPIQRIYGDDFSEAMDRTAFGDFNGDGYSDLLIVAGRPGFSFTDALAIVYGSESTPAAPIDLNTDGLVSPHGETRILPTTIFQRLGESIVGGDFDGDGTDDVIVSEDVGVRVIYGRDSLEATTINLNPNVAAAGQTLLLDLGNLFLASGDMNGDGYDDVVGNHATKGVFVAYGGPGFRGSALDFSGAAISGQGETRILIQPTGSVPSVSSLATGDINGDGFDDVLIGVIRQFTPGANMPNTYVIYGGAGLPGTLVDLSLPNTSALERTVILGLSANVVASGDINGDGFDEIVLGSAGVTGPGDNFAVGEVYVLYGRATMPGSAIDLAPTVGLGETRISGLEEFGRFAESLALCDLTGDGLMELAMGAPGSVPFGTLPEWVTLENGAVYVIHGRPTLEGQHFFDVREFADEYIFSENADDRLGTILSAGGDMDRDGVADLAASARSGDNPSLGAGKTFSGSIAIQFHGNTPLPGSATVLRATRSGDGPGGDVVPATDFGPVARATVDFSDDDLATEGMTTVTLSRTGTTLVDSAPVSWDVATTRTGLAAATLIFRYTEAEVAGLAEQRLQLFAAATTAGPFVPVASVVDVDRNSVTATVTGLGVFAIGEGLSFTESCHGDGGNQSGCTNCPCSNNAPPGTLGGCLNSAARAAHLVGSGVPSVMADTLRFELEGTPGGSFTVLTSGDGVAPQNMANLCFGMNSGVRSLSFDGLRCAVLNTRRHGGRPADANGNVGLTNNGWGTPSGPPAGLIGQGGFASGQTRHYQVMYRENVLASCMRGLNTSNAVTIVFQP